MGFGYKIDELYSMTVKEMLDALESLRKNNAFFLWKQAYLIGVAFGGKKYPKNPEEAVPEYFPKPSIPMPDFLREDWVKQKYGEDVKYG